MSLFSALKIGGSLLAKAGIIRGAAGRILGGGTKPMQQQLPNIPRASVPAIIGRTLPTIGRNVGRALPGIGVGVGSAVIANRLGQPQKKKRRRMNPCNDKALKRAIRRVQAYDKQRKMVDKALRTACPPSRRRAAPSRARKC